MPKPIDLTGRRFGRLVCRERVGRDRHRRTLWRCECDCTGEKIAAIADLRKGCTTSCGCVQREVATATLKKSVGVKPTKCRICEKDIPPTPQGRGREAAQKRMVGAANPFAT